MEPRTSGTTQNTPLTTFLFTDIEGSTRLWEREPERMRLALARHDAIAHDAVLHHHGQIVKMIGDGMHAVFTDPLDAIGATCELQQALADPAGTNGIELRVRCGMHVGVVERRNDDFFGSAVNRAARIMATGHGGQVLVSQAIVDLVRDRLASGLSFADLGTVRLRDLSSPEHLYQLVHPALRRDFPALRSLESTPNNLPQQLTSFVGRDHELEEVRSLLVGVRLVTLLGAGGIGKTRLALQVGAAVLDEYPDGVWLVELAALADPRLVMHAVASTLGVKEEAGHTLQDAVLAFVRDRQLLVVLDNCEHLVQACAEIARQMLQAGASIKLVATSRERLHLTGENVYQVQPLAAPRAVDAADPAALMRCDAVRLFAERAAAAQTGFALSTQNAAAVVEICRRLDGIPLALELAAARVRSLSVQQIADRIGDRFRLLTNGDRTALPRQQTLRALIDWSYELLAEPERILMRRLAVFAGGWTIDAAEAVAADTSLERDDILDLLGTLVEKSLVNPDPGNERYRLLETVQQYAAEHLRQAERDDAVRRRHVVYYVELAERARPELNGPQQAIWLARLDTERDNLLAAHAACDGLAEGSVLGLRLISATRRYWIISGLLGLGYRIALEALTRPGAEAPTIHRCRALFDIGQIGSWMGRYADAQGYLEQSLLLARAVGTKREIAVALQPLAMACLGQGDAVAASAHLTEALALAREIGDQRELAGALNALAQIRRAEGDRAAAEPLYRDAVKIARATADRENIGIGLLNLCMVASSEDCATETRDMLHEALDIAEATGSKVVVQGVLDVCTGYAALCRDWDDAARLYGMAQHRMRETGLHRDAADDAFVAPLVKRARDELGASRFDALVAAGSLAQEDAMRAARAWLDGPAASSAQAP